MNDLLQKVQRLRANFPSEIEFNNTVEKIRTLFMIDFIVYKDVQLLYQKARKEYLRQNNKIKLNPEYREIMQVMDIMERLANILCYV